MLVVPETGVGCWRVMSLVKLEVDRDGNERNGASVVHVVNRW